MTENDIRQYERTLMRECIEDAEKAIGERSPEAVAYIATAFFMLRRKGDKL